jgi:hypothetical protein
MPLTLDVIQPSLGSGNTQFTIEEKGDYPIIQTTGENGAPITIRHIEAVGGIQGHVSDVILDCAGRASGFDVEPVTKYLQKRRVDSYRHIFMRGTEYKFRGVVREILTPDGAALGEISIKVAAEQPDGSHINLSFVDALSVVEGHTYAQFVVTEVSTDPTDGYQILVVQRVDGAADMEVSGGNFADLAVGTFFTTSSANRDQSMDAGYQPSAQYVSNYQREQVGLFNTTKSFVINGQLIADPAYVSSNAIFYAITGDGTPVDSSASNLGYSYIMKSEAQQWARMLFEDNFRLIYGKPVTNPKVNVWPGSGLVSQVAPELRFQMALASYNYKMLERIVDSMQESNQFMGRDLYAFMGLTAFRQISTSIPVETRFTINGNPSETPDKYPFRNQWVGASLGGCITSTGVNIHFVGLPSLDNKAYSPGNNSIRTRTGSRSSDIIIMDPSPIMNYQMPNGDNPFGMSTVPMASAGHKVELLTHKDEFQSYRTEGTIDVMGKRKNGVVVDMQKGIYRQLEHRFGIAIQDPTSVAYIQCS